MKSFAILKGKGATLLRLVGTLLTLALMVYLLSKQGWDEIWGALQSIAAWRLLLALAIMMVSRLLVTGRWHILMRSSGLDISFRQSLQITFAGLFATNFLPTTVGGDVIRLAGAIQLRLDTAISAASLVVDRLVGMAGMALMLPFGLPSFLAGQELNQGHLFEQGHTIVGLASLPFGGWWRNVWEKGLKLTRQIIEALALWARQPGALFLSLLLTFIHMLCLYSILGLLFDGLGEHIPILLIGGLYSLVYFFTLLPFSINGYGLQELSMSVVFSSLAGASLSSGLAVALIFRTLMMIASLPGAGFVPGLLAARQESQ